MCRSAFKQYLFRFSGSAAGITPWVLILMLASAIIESPQAVAADLNDEQIALLEEMDVELAARLIAAVEKVRAWKARIEQAQAQAQAIQAAGRDPEQLAAVIVSLAPELKQLAAAHPRLARVIQYEQKIESVLREAEQKWRQAKYVADQAAGLSEQEFREQAKQEALAEASRQIREHLGGEVFQWIELMQDPAAYAENFLSNKFKEWISQPVAVDDEGTLMLKVVPPPAGVSVFSRQARLGVEIDYIPGQLVVRATGLYFRYRPGGTPVPIIDELKMEVDYEQTALNNIRALGQEMLADALGAPIKITLKGRPDFTRGAQGLRGGIPFDVQFTMFSVVDVMGSNLVLYPGNRVDWKDGFLKIDYQLPNPVPIPGTPFAFWTLGGGYGPKSREVEFNTNISTVATPPEVVALAVRCATRFPVKYIEVEGVLKIANIGLGAGKGKLDFEHGTLDMSFAATEESKSLIPGFSLGEGKLHLQREYITIDSTMVIFGMKVDEMHGEFRFDDGSGWLTSEGQLKLFGSNFAHELQATLGERFSYLQLRTVGSVSVSGIRPYGTISCTVIVEGDTRNSDAPLKIIVKTFRPELNFEIEIARLDECTVELLRREINKRAVESYHQFLRDLANGDKETRRIAAQWDQKSRNWADQQFGGPWVTGIDELDNLGSTLSSEWKNAGGAISGAGQQVGGAISDASKTVQGGLKKLDPTTGGGWKPKW